MKKEKFIYRTIATYLHIYTHTQTCSVRYTSHHKEKHYHHHLSAICPENLFKVFLLYTRQIQNKQSLET